VHSAMQSGRSMLDEELPFGEVEDGASLAFARRWIECGRSATFVIPISVKNILICLGGGDTYVE
jgi:hypothetical protein